MYYHFRGVMGCELSSAIEKRTQGVEWEKGDGHISYVLAEHFIHYQLN
jgi:hypothetical protein